MIVQQNTLVKKKINSQCIPKKWYCDEDLNCDGDDGNTTLHSCSTPQPCSDDQSICQNEYDK